MEVIFIIFLAYIGLGCLLFLGCALYDFLHNPKDNRNRDIQDLDVDEILLLRSPGGFWAQLFIISFMVLAWIAWFPVHVWQKVRLHIDTGFLIQVYVAKTT